uniref:NADH dehydrogenase subunit 2 n=1 Tax=Haemaphysalis punctata TaxID=49204 RepID=UPI001FAEF1E4|nr:NADH dehydrogenase subunit 2 [Haemaphysalis punctata]UNO53936.1 NADH dehydrogenase subunit 2 [Haemaphysalis punctata]
MYFKNLMKWMIMITIMVTISSNFWFIYWLMMEMNMMMFIPIIKNNKLESCNSMITYFIIQSFSSILFFISSSMFVLNSSIYMEILMNIAVLIKIAMIPFHFWLISISEFLDYNSLFFILSWQKIIPLFILSQIKMEISFFISMISLIFSSIMIFNLKMMKKILIFSSISHLSWVTILIIISSNFWISYLIIYFMMIYPLIKILNKNNIMSIKSILTMKMTNSEKMSMIMIMMSLGGMPPFMGFMIKLLAIMIIIQHSSIIMLIMVLSSLINTFIYIRMLYPMLLLTNKTNMNINFFKTLKTFINNMIIIMTLIMMNLMI